MYLALKELQRQTSGEAQEITYSWKVYIKLIDMIIAKIIRDLTLNMKNKQQSQQSHSGSQIKEDSHPRKQEGNSSTLKERERNNIPSHGFGEGSEKNSKKRDKEFTIDEDFFHSVIMPGIYTTVVAGIRQEYVPLFNLLFSLEISQKKTTINETEKAFFIKHFFQIKNCYDWRLNNHKPSTIPSGFVSKPELAIPKQQYLNLKKELVKLFPDLKKLFEIVESQTSSDFTFKSVSNILFKRIFKKESEDSSLKKWRDMPLMKKLLVGFICPDNEWRSKICQFVYEELSTIFDFNEEFNKLHNFIKTASWNLPVALFTQNAINIVNTVCSIASYYGVGLEVLRTDSQQCLKSRPNFYLDKQYSQSTPINSHQQFWEAAVLNHQQLDNMGSQTMKEQQEVVERMFSKEEMETEEKQMSGIYHKTQINLIKKCAENGTWVLISTLKFPSYWDKVCRKLERMASKGKILNTFRLFIDLQGYSVQEIPSSFLFDNCVKFYLTDRNNEDMEGFNDVWANILNDDLLNAKDINNVPLLIDSRSNISQRSSPQGVDINNMNSVTSSTLMQPRLLQSKLSVESPSLQSFSTPGSSRMQSIILNTSDLEIQRADLRSPPRAILTVKALQSDKLGYKYKRQMHIAQQDLSVISNIDDNSTSLQVSHGRDNNNQGLLLNQQHYRQHQQQPEDQEEVKSSSRNKQGLKKVVNANKKTTLERQQPIEMIQQVGSNRGNKRMQPAQKGAH